MIEIQTDTLSTLHPRLQSIQIKSNQINWYNITMFPEILSRSYKGKCKAPPYTSLPEISNRMKGIYDQTKRETAADQAISPSIKEAAQSLH